MAGMVTVMNVNDYAFFNTRGIRLVRAKSFVVVPDENDEFDVEEDTSNQTSDETSQTTFSSEPLMSSRRLQ